jgi:hypothetical protein
MEATYINNDRGTWTVWVGGTEVLDYLVDKDTADKVSLQFKELGYDDVEVENTEGMYV